MKYVVDYIDTEERFRVVNIECSVPEQFAGNLETMKPFVGRYLDKPKYIRKITPIPQPGAPGQTPMPA